MNKVRVNGDVGQLFTGNVQQVHIHCHPPYHAVCKAVFVMLLLGVMWLMSGM